MAAAGWYPDPGGQPGQFRYWDGTTWSAETTADPRRTPAPLPSAPATTARRRQPVGWWIAIGAVLVVVAVIIWAVVRFVPGLTGADDPWAPAGGASANVCAAGVSSNTAAPHTGQAGWVMAGHLAFRELGTPWDAPEYDNRVPFGTMAMMQTALDQEDYDGNGNNWVSSVLVSDLVSGDGFADSQTAARTVLACVLGIYYADNIITQHQVSAAAHAVDGHDGWLIETELSFNVTGLKAKGERVLLLVVQVDKDQFGLFYASVPDTSSARLPEVRRTLAGLRVVS